MYDIGTPILKFTWGANIITFSGLEVNQVLIRTGKKIDLQRLQNRQPVVYELGESYKTITVRLDAYATPMTQKKLEALRRVTSIMTMTMYYSDGVTQAEQFSVRSNPLDPSYYAAGGSDADREMGLTVWEASAGV